MYYKVDYFLFIYRRGSILSTTIFVYAATAPVNGFMGGSLYARQGGKVYLTVIPRVGVGYDLAISISYPTSASGINVFLKALTKYWEFFTTLFVKSTDF